MKKECSNCGRLFVTDDDFVRNSRRWRVANDDSLYFNCRCGSTLILPQGMYSWYSPAAEMSPAARTVFSTLQTTSLPRINAAVMRFEEMLLRENCTEAELATAARMDPMFSARILALANIRSRGSQEITSLEHALTSLGREFLHSLTLPSALAEFKLNTKELTPILLWREGILAGVAAERIGMKFLPNDSRGDELFLVGSLACLSGCLVGALARPEERDRLFASTLYRIEHSEEVDLHKLEEELGAAPHEVLGEIGVAIWGFPSFLVEAVGKHHGSFSGRELLLRNERICHLVSLANSISQILCWKNPEAVGPLLLEKAAALGISEYDLALIMRELQHDRINIENTLRTWFHE